MFYFNPDDADALVLYEVSKSTLQRWTECELQ